MVSKKIKATLVLMMLFSTILAGCSFNQTGKIEKVGMIFTETIDDQVWGTVGYKGLRDIGSELEVDIYYRENIDTDQVVLETIEEFEELGVNFIIGHGSEFVPFFNQYSNKFPNIHFLSMNGEAENTNITSIQFDNYGIGFFGGMVAAKMSKNEKIGIVSAYGWQSEANGFIEGAKFQNPNIEVAMEIVDGWYKEDKAVEFTKRMITDGVDVLYPVGNNYNVPMTDEAKKHGIYIIGYLTDQMVHGEETVLTSTVQHVDQVYVEAAMQFNKEELESGNLSVDFSKGVIKMGEFSSLVPSDFQEQIRYYVKRYVQTGKLPTIEED